MQNNPVKSRVWTNVRFDEDGRHIGHLSVPISENETGYAHVPIPITVVKNGPGPRVLLIGGNHGDEYEGQIILLKMSRYLKPEDVVGTAIIIPGLNAPAVEHGTRVSPLDGGNLNRMFPGNPRGTATEMIAHYLETELLSRVDYVFDLHSGGRAMEYLPSAVVCEGDDSDLHQRSLALLDTFGLPVSLIVEGSTGGDLSMVAACQRRGVVRISTEMPGRGSVAKIEMDRAEQGLLRVLHEIGMLSHALATEERSPTKYIRRHSAREFLYSSETGVFEPCVDLGDTVSADQLAGRLHFTHNPWREPLELRFKKPGVVIFKRVLARTHKGECVFGTGDAIRGSLEKDECQGGDTL
ncbi:succinylglutamate desuccinylase/aspartoacylase family protein [Rhizobium laguerreae]|uniref:succinylglutamate desuccinylase/aspartoacylase family protein n=1 Tax=Rhizobium laguerreae TaxID=1076926 RepID=UPI00103C9038|nr:succinylglutamate desuccinylase/aspartoacylase family protein [Rhizobium laguerreae]TBX99045.1 deacylase [Rhizobium laguerreae]